MELNTLRYQKREVKIKNKNKVEQRKNKKTSFSCRLNFIDSISDPSDKYIYPFTKYE